MDFWYTRARRHLQQEGEPTRLHHIQERVCLAGGEVELGARDEIEDSMWNYYRAVFLPVQIATGLGSWLVYRSTHHLWAPTTVFFLSMEIGAAFGAMWANRPRVIAQSSRSSVLN
jgi:hypothetical protein